MGAMPWATIGPYDADPRQALAKVQTQFFDRNYDLTAYIKNAIKSAEDCVLAVQENDEYGLLETYSRTLASVRKLAKGAIPVEKSSQIKLLRSFATVAGYSLDNILDIKGVASEIREWRVFPLTKEMLQSFFGTTMPTQLHSEKVLYKVYDCIDRAQCVCFNLYRQRSPQRPWGVQYVGYTAD